MIIKQRRKSGYRHQHGLDRRLRCQVVKVDIEDFDRCHEKDQDFQSRFLETYFGEEVKSDHGQWGGAAAGEL
jgi:hypothetical protein